MLTLQGIGWIVRKAISIATITLDVKQYRDDEGVEHIDIEQTATGGVKGTTENRTLDWTYVFLSFFICLFCFVFLSFSFSEWWGLKC